MNKLIYIVLLFGVLSCKTTKKTISNNSQLTQIDSITNTTVQTTINETEDLKEVITETITEKVELQYDSVSRRVIDTPIKITSRKIESFNLKSVKVEQVKGIEQKVNNLTLKDSTNYNRETEGQEVVKDITKGVFEGIIKGLFGDLFKMIVLYIVIFVMIIAFIIIIRKRNKDGK